MTDRERFIAALRDLMVLRGLELMATPGDEMTRHRQKREDAEAALINEWAPPEKVWEIVDVGLERGEYHTYRCAECGATISTDHPARDLVHALNCKFYETPAPPEGSEK